MDRDASIIGLEKLLKNMDKATEEIREQAMIGLQKAGMNIIADAQTNLRQNKTNVTGVLSQSGKVQKVNENTIEVGFISDNGQGYAEFVEYGRRSGRIPPPDAMEEWAYKKLRIRDRKLAKMAGWALAVHIGKNGTKPHPFFKPALDKNKQRVDDVIQETIDRIL